MAGAVLVETHEEWLAADRRYFSEGSIPKLYAERDDVAADVRRTRSCGRLTVSGTTTPNPQHWAGCFRAQSSLTPRCAPAGWSIGDAR
jgi:hypothetical protein